MTVIKDQTFDEERALYALTGAVVENCVFDGPADGESAMKESKNIDVRYCKFRLRYPLWHSHDFRLLGSEMSDTCRAPLWYSKNGSIGGCEINGVKCLRECEDITICGCKAVSPEFGWKCRGLKIKDSTIESEYIFLESSDLDVTGLRLNGKYSFQYVRNARITDSFFNTKDSFWHAKDVVIENTEIDGEYFGWYSENLTLRNCTISGTQPFCYCKGLRLESCRLVNCDLAFEYSDVEADILGDVLSVKNPKSGRITADSIGEIIRGGAVYPCDCEIVIRG